MVVSPALKDLLASPDGALLRERLPIPDRRHDRRGPVCSAPANCLLRGQLHPRRRSAARSRSDSSATSAKAEQINPLLVALVVLICVVLLMPVALFIATAVRFGGERRDRRLAALRLVGADAG